MSEKLCTLGTSGEEKFCSQMSMYHMLNLKSYSSSVHLSNPSYPYLTGFTTSIYSKFTYCTEHTVLHTRTCTVHSVQELQEPYAYCTRVHYSRESSTIHTDSFILCTSEVFNLFLVSVIFVTPEWVEVSTKYFYSFLNRLLIF